MMSAMSGDEHSTNDPCRAKDTLSPERFAAFALLFIVGLGVGSILFFLLSDTPYGVQLATAVSYTAIVMIYGSARNQNGIQPYLFTCPVVISQYPRLLKRHVGFLVVIILLETIALSIKPHLSTWWFAPSGPRKLTPFLIAVALPVGALAVIEVMTNRGVLKRAHRDRFGEVSEENEPRKDETLDIVRRD